MTCTEFRERCHILIDVRKVSLTDAEMLAHEQSCRECAEFFRGLVEIEGELRQIHRLAIPAPLLDSLDQIGLPHESRSTDWKPDIERAVRYILPGFLLWGAQWVFPETMRPYLFAALTFVGVFMLVTSVLRPRILGSADR